MSGKTYIVTGATGGIGKAIVKGLTERGAARVILACRNIAKARKLIESLQPGMTELTAMEVDLESLESVRRFAKAIAASGLSIDGLFNNAGTMPGDVILTADGYESATQTNFLATGLLTRLLLPCMADDGAIVFTTSMTRRIARLRDDWRERAVSHHHRFTTYGRSKLMLTHFAMDLSNELRHRHIRVNCSDPGIVDSAIITMDNKVIDYLSDRLFRPVISTPEQGAAPALAAMESRLTGHIFTLSGHSPIPAGYQKQRLHPIATDAVRALQQACEAGVPQSRLS